MTSHVNPDKYTGPPCRLINVEFYKPRIVWRNKEGVHPQSKGAVVTLDWWDTIKQKFERRYLQVSKERGQQFSVELFAK